MNFTTIATPNLVEVIGDRRKIDTYRQALSGYLLGLRQQVAIQAPRIRTAIADAVTHAWDTATSPRAMQFYRTGYEYSTIAAQLGWEIVQELYFLGRVGAAAATSPKARALYLQALRNTYDVAKQGIQAATVLVQFALALRSWLTRLDHEEIEEFQTALPYTKPIAALPPAKEFTAIAQDPWNATLEYAAVLVTPAPAFAAPVVASTPAQLILAPAPEPAPKVASASKRKSRKAGSDGHRKSKGDRKPKTMTKAATA